jgi:hypothetical protein
MLDRILIGSSAEPTDPNFKNVTLLLHGDGSNGAQNNTFLDSSTNNFTITRNGNTTQGSFSPYGSNWSNYFDGTGDYLTVPANTAFAFGTGDFTVEFWFNAASYRTSGPYYDCFLALGNFANSPYFRINQDGRLTAGITATNEYYTTSTVTLNRWTHFAVTRQGSTVRLFVNGVLETTQTNSTNLLNTTDVTVGTSAWQAANETFTGYLSNVRVLKGTAVYTSTFTPSTTPLTAITNTSLLTCQSNRFIDNSTNNFTITRNGDVKVTNFAPFAPTAAYSTTTNGGSAYFDGTDDHLTVASNAAFAFGTGDFTIECWVYVANTSSQMIFVDLRGASSSAIAPLIYMTSSGVVNYYTNGSVRITGTGISANSWNHLAVSRSGTSTKLFINGTQAGSTYSDSNNYVQSSVYIGRASDTAGSFVTGYMSNVRILKGTALYTSNFTPPSSPVTAITNTSLLTNFTNAAIFDNSMKNDLETVGNAQISTSVKKFGTGSMAFDGSGDYLDTATNQVLAFGTGDFTIEGWLYTNSTTGDRNLVDFRPTGTNGAYPNIFIAGGGYLSYSANASVPITGGTVIATGTWYHFALARSGTSTKLFLNGTQQGSTYTDSSNYVVGDGRPRIGAGGYGAGVANFSGYIDDLRITNGVARYTANFTAPTAPFPNK